MFFGSLKKIEFISQIYRQKPIIEMCLKWLLKISDDTGVGTFKIDHESISAELFELTQKHNDRLDNSWVFLFKFIEIHFIQKGSESFNIIQPYGQENCLDRISTDRLSREAIIVTAELQEGGVVIIFPNQQYRSRPLFNNCQILRKVLIKIPIQRLR